MPRVTVLLAFVFLAAGSLRSQNPGFDAETMASVDMLRDANVNADNAARVGSVTVLLVIERDSDGDGDEASTESRRIVQSLWSGSKLRLEVYECEGSGMRGKLVEIIADDGEAAYGVKTGEYATVMAGGAARSPYASLRVRPRPGAFWGLLDLPDSAKLWRDLCQMVECKVSVDASGKLTIMGSGQRGRPEWELAYRYVFDATQGYRPVTLECSGPVVSSTGIARYSQHSFGASFRDGCPWPERITYRVSCVRAKDGKATKACSSWERIELTRLTYSSDPGIPANAFSLAGLNLPPGTLVVDIQHQRSYRSEAPPAVE